MKLYLVTEGDPTEHVLSEVAAILQGGGVAILPTETIYGFHAAATNDSAIRKIDVAKNRDRGKPFVVLCASIDQAKNAGVVFTADNERRLKAIWPAPLTALLPTREKIAAARNREVVAVRISTLSWLRRLCEIAGPIASSSVNRSGEDAISSTKEVSEELLTCVDAIVDTGRVEGQSSTIVDLTQEPPKVVREGAFSFSQKLWKRL